MRFVLVAWCAVWLAPRPVAAHAILVDNQPVASATLPTGKVPIALRFNARIDQARSRLVLGRTGLPATVLPLLPSASDTLLATPELMPGTWVLRWQVLAVDGHISRGELSFSVRPPAETGG